MPGRQPRVIHRSVMTVFPITAPPVATALTMAHFAVVAMDRTSVGK